MWSVTAKIAAAVSLMMLLVVPVAFFQSGPMGALVQAGWTAAIFILAGWVPLVGLTAAKSPPRSIDARILTGVAFALVFEFSGEVERYARASVVGSLQFPILFGLLGQQTRALWFRDPGLLKKKENLPRTLIFALLLASLVGIGWRTSRWWSLLMIPKALLGIEIAILVSNWVRRWVLALEEVWIIARRMGPAIGGFAFGYLVIAFIFTGLFAATWIADSKSFRGLPDHPGLIDFAYYSVMTISTVGYGDVSPQSPSAKVLAAMEALIGLAWTIVIFAAVLTVVQKRLEPQQNGSTPNRSD